MNFSVALQLYSVREDMEADFAGTLEKVKEMGYDGVEFAGLYGHSAWEVKGLCEKLGLTPVAAHLPFPETVADPSVLGDFAYIGCEYAVIPYLPGEYRPGEEKFSQVVPGLKFLVEKARECGLKLAYHNHAFEFTKLGDEYALDYIFRSVKDIETELDTCWVNVGGENPAEYVTKYSGRASLLHLKDFVGNKGDNTWALVCGCQGADGEFELRPVGYGVQNFPEIISAAEKAGTKWLVVEQDKATMGLSALECAKKSIDYIKSL